MSITNMAQKENIEVTIDPVGLSIGLETIEDIIVTLNNQTTSVLV